MVDPKVDIGKMKLVRTKQEVQLDKMEEAQNTYNDLITEFDKLAKKCHYYRDNVVHGEHDPECDHPKIEYKWCEASDCPLLK